MNSVRNRIGFSLILLTAWLIVSCDSEMVIDLPRYEQKVVCNCLFSPETTWQVWVGTSQPFASVYNDYGIDNARVFVIDENGDTLLLAHERKGIYCNKNHKPEKGLNYKLMVISGNDTISSGWSKIPADVKVEVLEVVEEPGLVQYDFGTMDEVMEVRCKVSFPGQELQSIKIQSYTYNPEGLIERYTFNQAVFDSIITLYNDSSLVKPLLRLDGDTIYGEYDFIYLINTLIGVHFKDNLQNQILEIASIGKVSTKTIGWMNPNYCFSNSKNFKYHENNNQVLLGTFDQNTLFNVHLWDFVEGQQWLEVEVLSPQAFLYFESYLQQLEGRIDFGNIMQPAYSNISSGVGIFAGLIKVKEKVWE